MRRCREAPRGDATGSETRTPCATEPCASMIAPIVEITTAVRNGANCAQRANCERRPSHAAPRTTARPSPLSTVARPRLKMTISAVRSRRDAGASAVSSTTIAAGHGAMPPLIAATTALRKCIGAAPGIACEWPCSLAVVMVALVVVRPCVIAIGDPAVLEGRPRAPMNATATPETSVIHVKRRSVAKPAAKDRTTAEQHDGDRVREGQRGREDHCLFERRARADEREREQRFAVTRFEPVQRAESEGGENRQQHPERRLRVARDEIGESRRAHDRGCAPRIVVVAADARVAGCARCVLRTWRDRCGAASRSARSGTSAARWSGSVNPGRRCLSSRCGDRHRRGRER